MKIQRLMALLIILCLGIGNRALLGDCTTIIEDPVPVNIASSLSPSEFWWSVNRDDILYGDKIFKKINVTYEDAKKRNLKLKDPEHAKKIIKQLKEICLLLSYNGDFNAIIRKMAEAKLSTYTKEEVKLLVPEIQDIVNSNKIENRNLRLGATVAFGLRQINDSTALLKDILTNTKNFEEIAFSADALLKIDPAQSLALIKTKLNDKKLDYFVTSYINLCLAKHLDNELTQRFVDQVQKRNVNSNVRRTSLIALVMNDYPDSFDLLKKFINDKKENLLRYDAIRLLAFLKNKKECSALLVSLLKDRTAEIRREAAFALAQINDPSLKDSIYKHLKKERSGQAMAGLAYAYSLLGGPQKDKEWKKIMGKLYKKNILGHVTYFSAVGLALSKQEKNKIMDLYKNTYKKNKNYETRKGLILAMSLLNTEDSAEKIMAILDNRRDTDLRLYAAYGLGYMKRSNTIKTLAKATAEGNNVVRHAAVAAHGVFGPGILNYAPKLKKDPPKRLPALKKTADKDRVDIVRLAAAFSYDILSGSNERLKTSEVLSKLNASNFVRRTINGRAVLDKVNEFYPKYHKTFLGY